METDSLEDSSSPAWTKHLLVLAGIYNLTWGALVVLFPSIPFDLAGIERLNYPQIWQCVGMIVGVYGFGYLIAASAPFRHWPIVLVGLIGKLLGPLGFLIAAVRGELPWSWGITIVTNDLAWWVPFASILYLAFRSYSDTKPGSRSLAAAVSSVESQRGATLRQLSFDRPLLVLFLRHAGCTFCREALADLAAVRNQIEDRGTRIAVVHMSPPLRATQMFMSYGLEDLHRFSDPTCELYRAFGLTRGTLSELMGLKVLVRGVGALLRGHGLGAMSGDGFQMPGMFLMRDGRIVFSYRHQSSADRPDYVAFVTGLAGVAATGDLAGAKPKETSCDMKQTGSRPHPLSTTVVRPVGSTRRD